MAEKVVGRWILNSIGTALFVMALLSCATGNGKVDKPGQPPTPADAVKAAPAMTAADTVKAARERLSIRETSARTKKRPLILVHYMPWFEAPPTSSGYGYHWHMGGGVFDPYTTGNDGKANIASHYYPLTGPYDSRDPAILEYQAALMVLAGIDGAIFDWYGVDDALDYKGIHESTQAMVKVLKRAGLGFAVCWEDQSIGKMVEAKAIPREASLEAGKKVMGWLAANWFRDSSYVKLDGRPLLLCFGPQFYVDTRLWPRLFEGITPPPYFVGLDDHNTTDGSYDWPPMWAAVGGNLTPARLVDYLNDFYAGQEAKPHLVATAFPGFHDAYREAGAGPSYGYLDYAEGEIFDLTMDAALAASPDVIQIATWNDYGEGTIIEPTIERGFRELEYLQRLRKGAEPAFPYGPADLRAALELYKRKAAAARGNSSDGSSAARATSAVAVDEAYAALLAGDAARFRSALAAAGIAGSSEAAPVLRTPGEAIQGSVIPDVAAAVAAGKKNLAKGQPVEASSVIYEFVATKAVDGDVLSYWEGAADSYPNTLTVDLGSVRMISGLAVRLNPKKIWGARTQKFEVATSVDGSNFSALPSAEYRFDPAANANVVAVAFRSNLALTAKARWVRLTFTANTGAKAGQVAELEIYGE